MIVLYSNTGAIRWANYYAVTLGNFGSTVCVAGIKFVGTTTIAFVIYSSSGSL
jgi:ABC-type molybdate transport system permease subunit